MKYVLSRRSFLYRDGDRYCLSVMPGRDLQVSREAFDLASRFLRPRSKEDAVNLSIEMRDAANTLVDMYARWGMLVDERRDKAEILDGLISKGSFGRFSVYTDRDAPLDRCGEYIEMIKCVTGMIGDCLGINLENFNLCLIFDVKQFMDIGGRNLPAWARCFVYEDCLIHDANYIPSDDSSRDGLFSDGNLRFVSRELVHVLTYQHCRTVPGWLREGISEYIAFTLFPKQKYEFGECDNFDDLSHFFTNPDKSLLSGDSRLPLQNKLFYEAGQYVRKILGPRHISDLFSALKDYDPAISVDQHIANRGFL